MTKLSDKEEFDFIVATLWDPKLPAEGTNLSNYGCHGVEIFHGSMDEALSMLNYVNSNFEGQFKVYRVYTEELIV